MIRRASLCCLMLAASLDVAASGSLGGSGGYNSTPRPTDPIYEAGKSLANGRNRAYKGVKVCLKDPSTGELAKLKRKSISPYKRGSASALAKDLYNCKDDSQKILNTMQSQDFNTLLYYINKRYKLRLS